MLARRVKLPIPNRHASQGNPLSMLFIISSNTLVVLLGIGAGGKAEEARSGPSLKAWSKCKGSSLLMIDEPRPRYHPVKGSLGFCGAAHVVVSLTIGTPFQVLDKALFEPNALQWFTTSPPATRSI